jgi:hypothetical protein
MEIGFYLFILVRERECEFHDLKMFSLFHFNIKETSEDPNDNLCLKHQNTKVEYFSFLGEGM